MSKTALIAGGCSLVGIAAGGVGGYFLARRQFDASVGDLIAAEVEKTKKIYSLQIMQLKEGKPATLPAMIRDAADAVADAIRQGETAVEKDVVEPDPVVAKNGHKAQTDYAGIGKRVMEEKPPIENLVEKNIFTEAAPAKSELPPRRPDGRFLPKQTVPSERAPEDPYIITQEEFFQNEPDFDQETLLYYVNDSTLVVKADPQETVDLERVGEVNLTLFPATEGDLVSSIAVRNEKYSIDYDVELVHGSLVEDTGMGESESDLPDGAYL